MSKLTAQCYEFGPFRVDLAARTLLRDGKPITLTPKVFDLLVTLIRQRDRAISKEELMNTLWPNVAVEENNLSVNMSALRRALGDGANCIETLPRFGYRFVACVREAAEESATGNQPSALQSLAVLPFRPLGANAEDAYLGLGMADALITRLSNIRRIRVRPTSAVAQYLASDLDLMSIGRELQVDALLDGKLQRAGEWLRVTVQLVSVRDGAPLWAGKFDAHFTDIFAVQDSVSEQVLHALTLTITGEEQRLIARRHTQDAEAYRLFLKGRYHWNLFTAADLRKGVEYFQQAIEIDPLYALPYAGLADCYMLFGIGELGGQAPRQSFPKAKAAARRALEIDDQLVEALNSLAGVAWIYDWDWPGAEALYQRVFALNPRYERAHHEYALYLVGQARYAEALAVMQHAYELDPLSLVINTNLGWVLYYARRSSEAIAQYRRALELNPHFVQAHFLLGLAYEQAGSHDKAIAVLRRALSLSDENWRLVASLAHAYAVAGQPDEARLLLAQLRERSAQHYVSSYDFGVIHISLGETTQALACLEEAFEERSDWLCWLQVEPRLDPLCNEARFADLLQRVGLVQQS